MGPPETSSTERIWILQNRIDWITIAYQLEVFEKKINDLCFYAAEIRPQKTILEDQKTKTAVGAARAAGRLRWENADAYGVFDIKASEKWVLELTVRSEFLALHNIDEAIQTAEDIAVLFGRPTARRLRRIDVCADIGGWHIADIEAIAWITRSKGRVSHPTDHPPPRARISKN